MDLDLSDFDFSDLNSGLETGTPINEGGAFDMWGSSSAPGSDETIFGGTGENPFGGDPGILKQVTDWISSLPGSVKNTAVSALKGLFGGGGDASTGGTGGPGQQGGSDFLGSLLKLGMPAALVAGIFEKTQSPLVGPMKQAAEAAFAKAGEFGNLEGPGITPSQQAAIDRARTSSGAWRADLDKAGAFADESAQDNTAFRDYFNKAGELTDRAARPLTAHKPYFDRAAQYADMAGQPNLAGEDDFRRARHLADESAGPVTDQMITALLNPYLREVLAPAIKDLEDAAEQRRQVLRGQVARSGNDFRTPGTVNRYNVEDDLLDESMLEQIGALSGKMRYQGWDAANTLAREDLGRKGTASNLIGGLGRSRADIRGADLSRYLTTAGMFNDLGKGAGAFESSDLDRLLKGADIYGGLGGRAGEFRAGDLTRRANASTLRANTAKTRGVLDTMDFENLKSAGALERQPYEDRRANLGDTAKLYTGVVQGTAPALSATTPDSLLTKGVGALGALKSAKDLGIY